jgi:hypothetical protein
MTTRQCEKAHTCRILNGCNLIRPGTLTQHEQVFGIRQAGAIINNANNCAQFRIINLIHDDLCGTGPARILKQFGKNIIQCGVEQAADFGNCGIGDAGVEGKWNGHSFLLGWG